MLLRMRPLVALFVVAALCGCDSEAETPAPPIAPTSDACPAPNRFVDERCLEPGVGDDGCPAGSLAREDGSCVQAGIVPEQCGEGFEPTADMSCEPVLPSQPCAAGAMAVPGDAACRPVMPCGAGQWGDIPVDGTTQHVDASYTGGSSDGSAQAPWTTITEGVAAAAVGSVVAVAEGSYTEDVTINKRLRLHGVCPSKVELIGTGAKVAALIVAGSAASASEVLGLAITGAREGVAMTGATDVVFDRVWIHDTAGRGVGVENTLGAASLTLARSLVEACHEIAVLSLGAQLTIDASLIRDTEPSPLDPRYGRGVSIEIAADGSRSVGVVRGSSVDGNRESGIHVLGSDAVIEATVVRNTRPRASDDLAGAGIDVVDNDLTVDRGSATITSSWLDNNHSSGVFVVGSDANIESTVVRGTLAAAGDSASGHGVTITHANDTGNDASAIVRQSIIEDNREAGIALLGAAATFDGVVVRNTQPRVLDERSGVGIAAETHPDTGQRADLTLRGSRIELNHMAGIAAYGSDANIESTIVSDTIPLSGDRSGGRGIVVAEDARFGQRGRAALFAVLNERNHEFGIFVFGSDATVASSVIRGVIPRTDEAFGDGVALVAEGADATLLMTNNLVEANARAGVVAFAGSLSIGASTMVCNEFDLGSEILGGQQPVLEDLGNNSCGCPAVPNCKARSSGLEPPKAPTP
jgi:hypothetical protein